MSDATRDEHAQRLRALEAEELQSLPDDKFHMIYEPLYEAWLRIAEIDEEPDGSEVGPLGLLAFQFVRPLEDELTRRRAAEYNAEVAVNYNGHRLHPGFDHDQGLYYARCHCGWTSALVADKPAAQRLAEDHAAETGGGLDPRNPGLPGGWL